MVQLSAALIAAGPLAAQQTNCVYGETVVLRSSIDLLTQRALEDIARISTKPLRIKQMTNGGVLLSENSPTQGGPIFVPKDGTDLCSRVQNWIRDERVQRARLGLPVIIRNVDCNCNTARRADIVPNDPFYPQLYGLNQPSNRDIDAPEAWNSSTGSTNTIVAVIDTGIDYNHPDLAPNMWRNPLEIAGNRIDDDGNGYVDDIYGANTVTGSGDPMDDLGHGTHVAGILAAKGNNGIGIAGVAWNARIIAVKAFDSRGLGTAFDTTKAIDYVTDLKRRGYNIILSNNSWGGGGADEGERQAIGRAAAAGVLFVTSAGNNGLNVNSTTPGVPYGQNQYPLFYYNTGANSANMIAVAATQEDGTIAPYSNYFGFSYEDQAMFAKVHISAPGSNILSTVPGAGYARHSGTSMAAPHVSGALALLASLNPAMSTTALRTHLLASVAQSRWHWGKVSSSGTLNVNNLLKRAKCHNAANPFDVNRDGRMSPADGQLLINILNNSRTYFGTGNLSLQSYLATNCPSTSPCPYRDVCQSAAWDVNNRGVAAPIGALTLNNYLGYCQSNAANGVVPELCTRYRYSSVP